MPKGKKATTPPPPPAPPAADKLYVVIVRTETKCGDCGDGIAAGSFIRLDPKLGALCLTCADLDELVFLPSGDAAMTRRATKYSSISGVVVEWVRRRKRYERRGSLVEFSAIERAEAECEADAGARERQRQRRAVRAEATDTAYVVDFTKRIRELFPQCPPDEAKEIAEHACRKHSGRVGRTAGAKDLEEKAVTLAVRASVRHRHTRYDKLLEKGVARDEARAQIAPILDAVIGKWRGR